jgi:hypothetical protein
MSICSANNETDAQLSTTYNTPYLNSGTTTRSSCLPNGGNGWTSANINSTTGMVSSATVDSWVVTLISENSASPPGGSVDSSPTSLSQTNTDPANNFANKASQLRSKIDLEFCYYYVRYRYALTQVLTQAANSAIDRNSPTYVTLKTNTEKINQKLNQIIQILQSLANNRLATLSTYYGTTTGVNRVNSDLESIKTSLNRDALALKNSKMEANVKNAMMDYTIEKNNSSRNLLAIYGFLNIVAVGTIFYLYKNTAD